jgi:class 3 adenylate cyclase
VQAAVEVREAVAALSIELERSLGVGIGVRIGMNTGEVFASPGIRRGSFATGEVIPIAARLEDAAVDDANSAD